MIPLFPRHSRQARLSRSLAAARAASPIARRTILATLALALAAPVAACQQGPEQRTGSVAAGETDVKKLAASLQVKTAALIDAIIAKYDANIARAKTELEREANRVEDVIKSQTGPTANQVNSAINNIRTGILSNDVQRLERARTLLQQAAQ